jgi:hypothetical protein
MGDRGNIIIRDHGDVVFYAHSRGSSLPEIVQRALARNERWGDGPYLARIVFCELVSPDPDGVLGFGISTVLCDNEHDLIMLDVNKQKVSTHCEDDFPGLKQPKKSWTFAEFASLEKLPKI